MSTKNPGIFQLFHNCEGSFYMNFHRTLKYKEKLENQMTRIQRQTSRMWLKLKLYQDSADY